MDVALKPGSMVNLIFQGYDGLPIGTGHWFGTTFPFYPDYTAYVGLIVSVLAVVGGVLRWGRPEVRAFLAVAVIALVLAFFQPAISLAQRLPFLRSVHWHRSLVLLEFALAVLAGVGLDVLVRHPSRRALLRWAGGGFGVTTVVLGALWIAGRANLTTADITVRKQVSCKACDRERGRTAGCRGLCTSERSREQAVRGEGIRLGQSWSPGRGGPAGLRGGIPARCGSAACIVELPVLCADAGRGVAEELSRRIGGLNGRWIVLRVCLPTPPGLLSRIERRVPGPDVHPL